MLIHCSRTVHFNHWKVQWLSEAPLAAHMRSPWKYLANPFVKHEGLKAVIDQSLLHWYIPCKSMRALLGTEDEGFFFSSSLFGRIWKNLWKNLYIYINVSLLHFCKLNRPFKTYLFSYYGKGYIEIFLPYQWSYFCNKEVDLKSICRVCSIGSYWSKNAITSGHPEKTNLA